MMASFSAPRSFPGQVPKLVLMLSSPIDGEVVAAARAIGRTLTSAGMSFHDLAEAVSSKKPPIPAQRRPTTTYEDPPTHWSGRPTSSRSNVDIELVSWCFANGNEYLPTKDIAFLQDVRGHLRIGRQLSPRQRLWLEDIRSKIQARAA